MYEGKAGAMRLLNALEASSKKPALLKDVADSLMYDEDQLAQDIKALLALAAGEGND